MNRKTSLWLPRDLASLTTLCERADHAEGRIPPPSPWAMPTTATGRPLSELIDQYTPGHPRLVAEIQVHPIYKRMVAELPRIETAPAYSPFTPLRRVRVIADNMAQPMPLTPRKSSRWRKTSSRPDRKRAAELNAIRRLRRVTNSPERKRVLTAWEVHDMQRLPVALGKIAHPAVWWLAFDLLVHAHTADAQLLLDAAQSVDPSGCDDTTAGAVYQTGSEVHGHGHVSPKLTKRLKIGRFVS